jgi:hypothetical protein
MITIDQLEKEFTYHSPRLDQIPKYNQLREKAKEFAMLILELTPSSADQSAAIRKIREAVMTANAAIAINL